MKVCIAVFILLHLTSLQVVHSAQIDQGKNDQSMVDVLLAKYLPDNNRVLLILGQDLDSVAAYQQSELFPAPGGITTYLAFYHLNKPSYPAYGALGIDVDGNPVDDLVDWGGRAVKCISSRSGVSRICIGHWFEYCRGKW